MRTHMNEQDQNGVSHDGPGDKRVTSGDATTNEGAVQLHGRHHRTHAVPSRVSTVFIIVAFKYFFHPRVFAVRLCDWVFHLKCASSISRVKLVLL